METLTLILFGLILFFLAIQTYLIVRKKNQKSDTDNSAGFNLMQQQLNQVTLTLDTKLTESNRVMQQQFGQSFKVIADVTQKLAELDSTNKQVVGFAEQLQSLENILKNPKQRGILGEYYLETVLKNVLPPSSFQMQYKFKNGEIVDAAVFVKDKIIPIDSKFSLENYNRIVNEKDETNKMALEKIFKADLKLRIDETAKYIRPNENTMEFALMFIPSEGIYYDLLINEVGAVKVNTRDLLEYAFQEKRVIIVSPTNFMAYLQTVMQGLRALQIEESAKEIRERVEMLGKHLAAYSEYMDKLGGHLGTSVNAFNAAYKEFGKIDKDVIKITDADRDKIEIKQIDRPNID
jgi:DNA recombination protein RmuC